MAIYFWSLFLFILQSILIFTTNFNVWPELYFFPWLVRNGLLPYRDFFDHHGPLLYYLMAPLGEDKTYFLLHVFYFIVQSVNLILVLAILKKTTVKSAYYLGGLLIVLINYYVGENNLWYETAITTFYLAAYFLLTTKHSRYKSHISGILIALTSFIKPVAAIILLPIYLIKRDFRMVFSFTICWIILLAYFFWQNSMQQLLTNLILFNNYLAQNYRPAFFSDGKFIASSIFLVSFSVGIAYQNKSIMNMLLPLSFLFSSLIFLSTGYGRWHLLPVMTFFILIVSQAMKFKKSNVKIVFVALLSIYTLLLARKVFYHYRYLNTQRVVWQESLRSSRIISALKNINIADKQLYIFSNHAEIYHGLNKFPPTYFAVRFPLADKYFPLYQEKIISDLKTNKVEYVVVPKPVEEEYISLPKLKEFIENYYSLKSDTDDFLLYTSK